MIENRAFARPLRGTAALLLGLGLGSAGGSASADDIAVAPPLEVPRLTSEIKVDGLLDEVAWQRALAIPLRYETRPGENTNPPVETDGLLLYDDSALYVAFRARDPEPRQIRAHLSDRDTAWNDDFVGVVLDTFNDERRAFEFFVNPLGVQMDVLRDDVYDRGDSSWDAIWSSAGRITEEGYVVEVAIPFHSLRFPSGSQAQTWGIDMRRNYPRSQRHRISSQPLDRDRSCYLCQISKIEGFENLTPGRNLELVPTVVSSRTDARDDSSSGELTEGEFESEAGLTVSWGMTPNLTLMGTVNPDFSQVEADVAQLDVNNQFTLFFPERRPFFLEGADFFETPLNAVFTRNVADPDWGLKLTGKVGGHGLGVFAAEDQITNLLFPGSQGSDAGSFDFATTDSVLRYRRDIGRNSALGALVTNRDGKDYSNLVSGLDGSFRFKESNTVSFQYLASQTEYPAEMVEEYDQPDGSFSDAAFRARFSHNSRNWNAYAQYQDIGAGFRADMGFMPRVDYRFTVGGGEHIWWGEEQNWWTQIRLGGDVDRTEDQSGRMLEQETEVWTLISGPKQSWLWAGVGTRDRYFDGVEFDDETFVNTWFEIQPSGAFFFGMFTGFGDDIDFANTRPAERFSIEPQIRYNIRKHLRINLSHELRRLDVDGGELFEANLTQLRAVYQFNIRTFLRLITQYTDIERDPTLYVDEVEPNSETLFNQLLFAYKLNPRTVAFLGYSDTRVGDTTTGLEQDDRSVFLKIGYSWTL
jgi:hypothetical protein